MAYVPVASCSPAWRRTRCWPAPTSAPGCGRCSPSDGSARRHGADARPRQARDGAGLGGQPRLADLRARRVLDGLPGGLRLDHLDARRAAADRRDRHHLPRRRVRAARAADASRAAAESLFAVSSVLTPFALGTAVGAIATGRVPVGNAAGNEVTSWLTPAVGADRRARRGRSPGTSRRSTWRPTRCATASRTSPPHFRRRALLAGRGVRRAGPGRAAGDARVRARPDAAGRRSRWSACPVSPGWPRSPCAGASRFGLARLTAALAVAAVVVGWAAAQAPRFLPGMTVTQAAAGESTLVALVIAVACGLVVPDPVARPAVHAVPAGAARHAGVARAGRARRSHRASPAAPGAELDRLGRRDLAGDLAGDRAAGAHGAGEEAGRGPRHAREWGGAAVLGLAAGAVLLVFTDATWTHALGVAGLLLCAIAVFTLTATTADD